jgi:glutamate/tyrosine decarboxylase-like PLP-dependent enzyme
MVRRLSSGAPAQGRRFEDILAELEEHVLPFVAHWGHPGCFAFIPGSSTFPGALGDFIASALNIDTGAWSWGSGPSHIELIVIDWFKQWIGYPSAAAGVLVSGGSAANMTALACAREATVGAMSDDLVAYCSDQAHSSVARAARALGFRPDQLRVLPADERCRMRPDVLANAIEADVAAGRRPLFVVASAGTTSTGAIDPFFELAAIAKAHGAWLHVDGAYGAFAVLTERGAQALSGLELADSVTLDPHKWLYQPFEWGCLLVRDGHLLDEAFVVTPVYLTEAAAQEEVNFSDRGLQLTRAARALKLWVSLNYFGLDTFRDAIDRSLDLALLAQRRVQDSDDLELLLPTSLGVTCFRRRFGGTHDEDELARLNAQLVSGLAATDKGVISSTRLRGRYALRMCVLNHTSTEADVEHVLSWLEQTEVAPAASIQAVHSATHDRHPDVASVRLERDRIDPATLGALALFASLTDAQLERVARSARVISAVPGEAIVRKWDAARDFFVLADGTVDVRGDGEHYRDLGPGDFFGELAALEWGAGFGYPRLATVTATSPVKAVVLSSDTLNALMDEAPDLAKQVRSAVRERLPSS